MLTRLLSLNLFEAWLKFNSCPSPNASRVCVCVLLSSGSVSSFKLSPGLFSLSGPHFIHAWGTPGAANNWIFHQGYFLCHAVAAFPRCVPTSYITYPALTRSSLSRRCCLTLVQIREYVLWSQHWFVMKLEILWFGSPGLVNQANISGSV